MGPGRPLDVRIGGIFDILVEPVNFIFLVLSFLLSFSCVYTLHDDLLTH